MPFVDLLSPRRLNFSIFIACLVAVSACSPVPKKPSLEAADKVSSEAQTTEKVQLLTVNLPPPGDLPATDIQNDDVSHKDQPAPEVVPVDQTQVSQNTVEQAKSGPPEKAQIDPTAVEEDEGDSGGQDQEPTQVQVQVTPSALEEHDTPIFNKAAVTPKDSIGFWLGEAGWAFEKDKLTTPKGDNALYYLNRVLQKQPNNPQALQALEKLVQRYFVLLRSSLNQGKVAQARVFLTRAIKVLPKHSEYGAMQTLIDSQKASKLVAQPVKAVETIAPPTLLPAMRIQKLQLPLHQLKQQDAGLAQWLVNIAVISQDLEATMLIVAPTDAQARWVYRMMNGADPDKRIRANIKRGKVARIEVSYMAREDALEVYPG